MIENFAAFAARRPIAISVFALVITVLGYFSLQKLALDLFPDIQIPTVLVSVDSGDRPAEQMERLYGERIEQLLFTVPGLKSIEQVVRNGRLISRVTFDWDTDIDLALVDVNRAVARIASDPNVDEVRVRRFDTRQLPIVVLGLSSKDKNLELAELTRLAKRQIAPHLEQLDGVAEVRVSGGRVKQVQVVVNSSRARAYGINLNEIRDKINASNLDFNAGTMEEGDKVLLVRGKSRFISPLDIEKVVIKYLDGIGGTTRAVKISDIADVVIADAEITNLVRINGDEGVGLFIYKESNSNTVSVSKVINEAIEHLQSDLANLDIQLVSDEAALIKNAIDDVKSAALFGIILSIAVLILFLRSPGPIVIVAIAVPVSLLATTFAMELSGHTLNLMTLGGIALGAGMLVDNAIVVIESIFRRKAKGDNSIEAAKKGTALVGGAIVASTLTTCIVFLPVLFIEGLASKLVSGISFSVVVSLIASLFVAIFLIPSLSIGLLPKDKVKHIDPGNQKFKNIILHILDKPKLTIFISSIFVAVAVYSLNNLGTQLLPPNDPNQFTIKVNATPGQRIESTVVNVAAVEEILSESAAGSLDAILSEVGKLDDDDRVIKEEHSAENTAEIRIRLKADSANASKIVNSASPLIANLYGTQVDWKVGSSILSTALGRAGPPIAIQLSSNSIEDLRKASEEVEKALAKSEIFWNLQTSFEGAPEEIHVKLRRPMADALNVDVDTIQSVISASLDGLKVTRFSMGDETRDVVLKLPQIKSEDILGLTFLSPNNTLLSINDVAEIEIKPGAKEILRKNQRRVALVTSLVSSNYSTPEARSAALKILQSVSLPLGMSVELAGDESEREKTVNELTWAGALALLLVLMVLAGSFESLLLPFVILASIPIAVVGVAIVLVPQGDPIGIMAMLGFVVLVGVAVNDSILLVQTAKRLIDDGIDIREALAQAVSLRLRPIIMTTATTVLSLLPLALSAGEAAQLRSPLAWTVVGGILISTIGCLTVIPCIYLLLDSLKINKSFFSKRAHDPI